MMNLRSKIRSWRLLSSVLAVVLVVGLAPGMAFADDAATINFSPSVTPNNGVIYSKDTVIVKVMVVLPGVEGATVAVENFYTGETESYSGVHVARVVNLEIGSGVAEGEEKEFDGGITVAVTPDNGSYDTVTETYSPSIVIDKKAPTVSIPAGAFVGGANTTVSVSVSDNSALDESSVTAKVDDTSLPASLSGDTVSVDMSGVDDGVHILMVSIKDRAGNEASVKESVTVEKTAPEITITPNSAAARQEPAENPTTYYYEDNGPEAISIDITDASAIQSPSITVNGVEKKVSNTVSEANKFSGVITPEFDADGKCEVVVAVSDTYANTANPVTKTFVVETSTPEPAEAATLTFDLGGGTLDGKTGSITIEANVGDKINLPGAPTKDGYTFKCWKGSEYAAGAEYTVEGNHAFTAEWEKNAEPSQPDTKTDTAKSAIPATGDDAGMLMVPIAIVAGISLVVLIGSAVRRRAA